MLCCRCNRIHAPAFEPRANQKLRRLMAIAEDRSAWIVKRLLRKRKVTHAEYEREFPGENSANWSNFTGAIQAALTCLDYTVKRSNGATEIKIVDGPDDK